MSSKLSKHEQTVFICKSKINSVKDIVSKALADNKISHEKFLLIQTEFNKYYQMRH